MTDLGPSRIIRFRLNTCLRELRKDVADLRAVIEAGAGTVSPITVLLCANVEAALAEYEADGGDGRC